MVRGTGDVVKYPIQPCQVGDVVLEPFMVIVHRIEVDERYGRRDLDVDDDHVLLRVEYSAIDKRDRRTPILLTQDQRIPRLYWEQRSKEGWVRDVVRELMTHEIAECLTRGGELIQDPHAGEVVV